MFHSKTLLKFCFTIVQISHWISIILNFWVITLLLPYILFLSHTRKRLNQASKWINLVNIFFTFVLISQQTGSAIVDKRLCHHLFIYRKLYMVPFSQYMVCSIQRKFKNWNLTLAHTHCILYCIFASCQLTERGKCCPKKLRGDFYWDWFRTRLNNRSFIHTVIYTWTWKYILQ